MRFDKKKIGGRIKSIREGGNWNLEDFGELVFEASKGTVSNWENGVNIPSKKRLERIAKIAHKSVSWILYGNIEEYVKQLFSYFDSSKFDNHFFDEVFKKMKEKKVSYEENEAIFQIAIEIKPELRNDKDFNNVLNILGTSIEEVSYYDIEENRHYRQVYLPMLSNLFKDEENIDKHQTKYNDQILLRTFDMLSRVDTDLKESINDLITKISWVSTENIFKADLSYLPEKYSSYGGYAKSLPFLEFHERTQNDAIKDYDFLKEEMIKKIDEIFEENNKKYYLNKK